MEDDIIMTILKVIIVIIFISLLSGIESKTRLMQKDVENIYMLLKNNKEKL